jgi:hypothetical protein
MPTDLREKIARIISNAPFPSARSYSKADAILALYVAHLTSDEAMARACKATGGFLWPSEARAAILAALDGEARDG